jgi:hypothetical protein
MQQAQALVFGGQVGGDEREGALDLRDRHGRRPQTADEHQPVNVVFGEAPMSAGVRADIQQPDALGVPQRMGAHLGPLGYLRNREGLLLDGECAHEDQP